MCTYRFRNTVRCEEPALPRGEFCILHSPLPDNEESEEFKRLNALKENKVNEKVRNGDFNFEGAQLLEVNFARTKIEGGEPDHSYLNFADAVIRKSVTFEGAEIGLPVSFEDAQIGEHAVFAEANLRGHVWFEGAKLEGDANFRSAVLEKDARFNEVKIAGNAWFEGTKIVGEAYFEKAEIGGKAWFERAEIGEDAVFESCDIGKDAWFANAEIGGELWLDKARIGGDAWFEGARLNGALIRLYDLKLKGKLSFKNATFKLPRVQEEACRAAKRICEAMDNREDADYHFYREMTARRTLRVQNALQKKGFGKITAIFELISVLIEWLLADLTCKYGSDWKRPIYLWVAVILGCAALYWAGGGIKSAYTSGVPSFAESLYYSIVTITTLGYGDYYPKPGFFQYLAQFEALFGVFMWAMLIAVFARKYMR